MCHTVYVTKTRTEKTSRTVEFFPHHISMPTTLSVDNAVDIVRMLAEALSNPAPTSPFNTMGSAQMRNLHQLSYLFAVAILINEMTAPMEDPIRPTQLPPTSTLAPRVPIQPQVTPYPPVSLRTAPRVQTRLPASPRGRCNYSRHCHQHQ